MASRHRPVGASSGLASWESTTMQLRLAPRALALAVAGVMVFAGVVTADSVRTDGDPDQVGNQAFYDLGQAGPGEEVPAPVDFWLFCTNGNHVDPGQSVVLTWFSSQAPLDGAVVDATTGSTAAAPVGWTADGEFCPTPAPPPLVGGTPSMVTLRAPTTPGAGYQFIVFWSRSLTPAGNGDGSATSGTTAVTFELEVVANTPPVLTAPDALVVEGDTTDGWTADWSGVTAADTEDDPDPKPLCSPAAGEVLSLGTTTVSCSVVDSGGLDDTASFDVTVVDTTDPVLAGVPADLDVTTGDPDGIDVPFTMPTASDVVDANPTVTCDVPASGHVFAVGATTVTCTATDDQGNTATGDFKVRVAYVPAHIAKATWGEPVGAGAGVFVANRVRTVPVKVTLSVDGEVRTTGDAVLTVAPCGGGAARSLPLAYGGGRWNAALDTSALAGSCHTVTASIDGLEAGSFRLELRSGDVATQAKRGRSR
jgi:hypothetical protein